MKLRKTLVFFFNLNHMFCLFPYNVQNSKTEKLKLSCNWLLYCIKIPVYVGSFFVCQYKVCYERTVDLSLQEIVFNLCSFYTSLVVLFVNLHSLEIRNALQKAFYKLEMVAEKVAEITEQKIGCGTYSNIVLGFEMLYLSVSWTYMFTVYYYFYDFLSGTLFLIGFTLPKYIVILSSFTFVHYALMLNEQFQALNYQVQSPKLTDKDLRRLAEVYFKLGRLTKKINDLYGYQNLVLLSKYFLWIIFEMYHFFLLASQDEIPWSDVKLMIFGFTWSCIQLTAAGSLLIVCGTVKHEANKFGYFWSNTLVATNTEGMMSISLKLAITQVNFSTNGWFDMDFVLLLEMVGSITTFIVILTQFSTKFISNDF